MTTPRWGHKPPSVADRYVYWGGPPPEPSQRMTYWARRWRSGEWEPNRRLRQECPDCKASMLGVWLWESRFVVFPLELLRDGMPAVDIADMVAEWSDGLPGPYWTQLEERSRWGHRDPDESWRDDLLGGLADEMERAVRRSATAGQLLAGRRR